jgi:hypothetical protein
MRLTCAALKWIHCTIVYIWRVPKYGRKIYRVNVRSSRRYHVWRRIENMDKSVFDVGLYYRSKPIRIAPRERKNMWMRHFLDAFRITTRTIDTRINDEIDCKYEMVYINALVRYEGVENLSEQWFTSICYTSILRESLNPDPHKVKHGNVV